MCNAVTVQTLVLQNSDIVVSFVVSVQPTTVTTVSVKQQAMTKNVFELGMFAMVCPFDRERETKKSDSLFQYCNTCVHHVQNHMAMSEVEQE